MSASDTTMGPWTRLRIGASVALSLCFFALASGLCTWLAERPGLRTRVDLTHTGRNTLDPALQELVTRLPERTTIDVFFQPVPPQIGQAGEEAQRRMAELLDVLRNSAPEKILVQSHSAQDLAEARDALSRLQVDGDPYGLVVVHREKSQAVLRLFQDIAQLDFGNVDPDHFVPPKLVGFHGEEALARALKRVSSDQRPKVYFSTGHGERNLYSAASSTGNEAHDLGALASALIADGFETERFEGQGQPIPADCAAFAVVDPAQGFSEPEAGALHAYVARGGRLLLTASHRYRDGPGSTRELAARYGIDIGDGYVAQPAPSAGGPVYGLTSCANLFTGHEGMSPSHPVTESLARFDRRVWSALARPLSRRNPPANVVLTPLLASSSSAWIDLPDDKGAFDWRPDPEREERGQRFTLAFAAEISPAGASGPTPDEQRGRLIVLGSPELLTSNLINPNKDFDLNAFNWLVARDYRISVAPRSDERRLLELREGTRIVTLRTLTLFLLPGLCAFFGLVTWYRRRR